MPEQFKYRYRVLGLEVSPPGNYLSGGVNPKLTLEEWGGQGIMVIARLREPLRGIEETPEQQAEGNYALVVQIVPTDKPIIAGEGTIADRLPSSATFESDLIDAVAGEREAIRAWISNAGFTDYLAAFDATITRDVLMAEFLPIFAHGLSHDLLATGYLFGEVG